MPAFAIELLNVTHGEIDAKRWGWFKAAFWRQSWAGAIWPKRN